ncbi:MAG: hypothetical protein DMD72_10200 [Gemmatimonadetes bacterium]|nr:MAG: hypothetical protein DMD72_10200 [Gemmatimonadota bacterium]
MESPGSALSSSCRSVGSPAVAIFSRPTALVAEGRHSVSPGGALNIAVVGTLLSVIPIVAFGQTLAHPIATASEPGETHVRNIRQLTNGGENAEAYFSHDGKRLIFQSTRDGRTCDQQFVMRIDGSHVRRVSNGSGKTTCGYFMDGDRRIFFASRQALEKD